MANACSGAQDRVPVADVVGMSHFESVFCNPAWREVVKNAHRCAALIRCLVLFVVPTKMHVVFRAPPLDVVPEGFVPRPTFKMNLQRAFQVSRCIFDGMAEAV